MPKTVPEHTYLKNGINDLPISYKKFTGFAASVVGSCNITITQLPTAYEGGLVFDGVDDYGICTGLPILDDYTVICRREIINKDYYSIASKSTVFGKGAIYYFALYNKSLTPEEIETEKERLNEEWLKRKN